MAKKTLPQKPNPDFPLFAHQSGQWAKKINGKTRYFGVWADPIAALRTYKEQVEDLLIGREPTGDGLTLKDLANEFLEFKKKRMESGKLSSRHFGDCYKVCERVLDVLGKNTSVENLRPIDCEKLRASFAETHGVERLAKDITTARSLFKYAAAVHGITVRQGTDFCKPDAAEFRKARKEKPKKFFSAAQLRAAIDKANPTMKAVILVGLNAALGNEDIANLAPAHIKGDWLDYPRSKTGEERRAWLWPETREALDAARSNGKHLFLRPNGDTWNSADRIDKNGCPVTDNVLTKAFNRLIPNRPSGVSFYALRHVFQTVAEKGGDKDAVRAVMGHATPRSDMSNRYSEDDVENDRIKAVCVLVRDWLFDRPEK